MASIQFGPADRDDRGFVKLAEPRSLADLLPTPQSIQADAQRDQPRPPTAVEWMVMVVVLIGLLALLAYLWPNTPAPAAPARVPATVPAAPLATVQPTSVPPPIRMLVAFAAPDGVVLGAIESTRAMTPTAHYGTSWIQANVAGSGLVWLRASDAPDLGIVGPDLAPRRAEARPARPVARPAVQPTEPPAPPCAAAGVPGKMVQVCDYAELATLEARAKAQWIEQYGGNAGIVTTPTPPDWSRP